ncbi:partner of Y14 and mago [Harpegnathos saltator]|uniref:Partner of Y14 and mago n=1 Tax=Harpegnathos saltator TaxID=610380 RepID=E2C3R6_HARSA|nr:partner of Y14 and mago [Harpegnathos saltator]EFN77302.1 Protein wibg-like protein [Harpegnathos saltator]
MASAYIKDESGGTFIPASQRPDGTWRKPRRVKDGYIPQEEVPLYESKGKQLIKKPLYPVGASPEFIAEHKAKQEALAAKNKVTPGTQGKAEEGKKKKKKNKSKTTEPVTWKVITEGLSSITTTEPELSKAVPPHNNKSMCTMKKATTNNIITDNADTLQKSTADPQKRLKNLRKKVREIEALEEKIKTGALKNPEKEILDKVARKTEISKEIKILEAALS